MKLCGELIHFIMYFICDFCHLGEVFLVNCVHMLIQGSQVIFLKFAYIYDYIYTYDIIWASYNNGIKNLK